MTLVHRSVVAFAVALLGGYPAVANAQTSQPAQDSQAVLDLASEPPGFFVEPDAVRRAAIFADRNLGGGDRTNGLYADLNLIPGSGWIGGGPGYRHWYARDQVLFDASTGISWHGYRLAQGKLELAKLAHSRLTLGSKVKFQDFMQIAYFGQGPESVRSNHAEYRLRSTDIVGYAVVRPVKWIGIGANLGWVAPTVLPRGGIFMRPLPDVRQLFAGDPVFRTADTPSFLHSEGSIVADTRDFPDHATAGTLLRGAFGSYSDRDTGRFSFRRYEVEGEQFVPLAGRRIVIALHGWLVASGTDAGEVVPFYLQPSLGGNNTLRSFADYRFHDRNLLLLNVEGRIALTTHVDGALTFDAGNVAGRVADLNLDHQSYGMGVRLHTRRQTIARYDVAHGADGWRTLLSLADPLTLSRLTRRTATAPFVP